MIKAEIRPLAVAGPVCSHCGARAIQVTVTRTVETTNAKTGYHRVRVTKSSDVSCGICERLQAECTCLPV